MAARSWLLTVLIAFFGYGLVSEAFRFAMVPFPELPAAKFRIIERRKDTLDAIFIGSSRVMHGLRPDVIDPLVSKPGKPFRSFNLSLPGQPGYEMNYILEAFLALDPERLRYVVVEAPTWMPYLPRELNERWVHWHDRRQTVRLLRSVVEDPSTTMGEKAALVRDHLTLMVYRQSSYGLGPAIFRGAALPMAPATRLSESLIDSWRGFAARDPTGQAKTRQQSPTFKKRAASHDAEMADWDATRLPDAERVPLDFRAMQHQREAVEAAGFRFIPIAMPGRVIVDGLRGHEIAGELEGLWNFAQPEEYPELFESSNLYNADHLNDRGATLLSELVAARLRELERAGGRP